MMANGWTKEDEIRKMQLLEEGLDNATALYKLSCSYMNRKERKIQEDRIKFFDQRLAEMGEE